MTPTLRDYQLEAIHAIRNDHDNGLSTVAVMATGLGKTATALAYAATRNTRTLWIAHRDELITQAANAATRWWPEASTGIVMGSSNQFDATLVCASIQTLAKPKRMAQLADAGFGLVVVDEAHRSRAASYENVLSALREAPAPPMLLGLTATPDRLDKKGLGDLFDTVAVNYDIRWGMAHGHLCDLRSKSIDLGLDLSGVKTRGGDYADEDLELAMREVDSAQQIVDAWLTHAENRKTVVMLPTVSMAQELADAFNALGVPSAAVWGTMGKEERRAALRSHQEGDLRVITSVAVLIEGYDDPSIECVIIARPTKSRVLYTQAAGRGLRNHPGKTDCIAEGQRVLTDCGLVPIESVTKQMRVWDGVDFVGHDGAICKGEQDVIEYAGLVATPDHNVWTDAGWRTFADCQRDLLSIRATGDGWRPVRETDHRFRRNDQTDRPDIPVGHVLDLWRQGGARQGVTARRIGRVSDLREPKIGAEMARTTVQRSPAAMHESERLSVRTIRRQGYRVPLRRAHRDGRLGAGELGVATRPGDRPDQQQRALRAGQSPVGEPQREPVQYAAQEVERGHAPVPSEAPRDPVCGLDADPHVQPGHVGPRDHRQVPAALMQTKRRVWDILNAGPRHRFTVEGLLVSNCLLLDLVGAAQIHSLMTASDLLGVQVILDGETAKEAMARDEAEQELAVTAAAKVVEQELSDGEMILRDVDAMGRPRKYARFAWAHVPTEHCYRRWGHMTQHGELVIRPNTHRSVSPLAGHPDHAWVAALCTTESARPIATGKIKDVLRRAEQWLQRSGESLPSFDGRPGGPTAAMLQSLQLRGIDASDFTRGRAGVMIGQLKAKEERILVDLRTKVDPESEEAQELLASLPDFLQREGRIALIRQ